jgi:hypothetical protein
LVSDCSSDRDNCICFVAVMSDTLESSDFTYIQFFVLAVVLLISTNLSLCGKNIRSEGLTEGRYMKCGLVTNILKCA